MSRKVVIASTLVEVVALLDKSEQPVYMLNRHNQLIYANAAFWEQTQLEPEAALGQRCEPGSLLRFDRQRGVIEGLGLDWSAVALGRPFMRPWPAMAHATSTTERQMLIMPFAGPEGTLDFTMVMAVPWPATTAPAEKEPSPPAYADMLARLKQQLLDRYGLASFIAVDDASVRLLRQLSVLSKSTLAEPVTLSGPPGSGKSHLATVFFQLCAIDGPLLVYDCADHSPQEALCELLGKCDELAGERVAEEAQNLTPSYWEQARGGMLVLENIDQLPGEVRAALQQRYRDEDMRPILVTTTQCSQDQLAQQAGEAFVQWVGTFWIDVPPLAVRRADVLPLAAHFIERANRQRGSAVRAIDPAAQEVLLAYDWPGNVRELAEVIELACARAGTEDLLRREHLPAAIQGALGDPYPPPRPKEFTIELDQVLQTAEAKILRFALIAYRGNKTSVAQALGISRAALLRRLAALGIDDEGELG